MITAKVICDSISANGIRLTTIEATLPRIILAELRTHRQQSQEDNVSFYFCGMDEAGRELSMNSASSRAIPVDKMIKRVQERPFIPDAFPLAQKGMQPAEYVSSGTLYEQMVDAWLTGRDEAVKTTLALLELGVHKEIANRPIEPYMWHTVILSATEWSNFFAQRCHSGAQRQMQLVAHTIYEAMNVSMPDVLDYGQWHLPYMNYDERMISLHEAKKISIARCARVSYLQHDGVRSIKKDIELYNKLVDGMHWSPFEHVATPMPDPQKWSGNFRGWFQARKEHANECR